MHAAADYRLLPRPMQLQITSFCQGPCSCRLQASAEAHAAADHRLLPRDMQLQITGFCQGPCSCRSQSSAKAHAAADHMVLPRALVQEVVDVVFVLEVLTWIAFLHVMACRDVSGSKLTPMQRRTVAMLRPAAACAHLVVRPCTA